MRIRGRSANDKERDDRAFALLDVVLAVTLFAIVVTGILQVMRRVSETSAEFARDRYIQQRLEGLLAERQRLELGSMNYEMLDELSNITFRTYTEPWQVDNGDGATLAGLYKLTAEAVYIDDGGEQTEKAELIIYVPES